MLKTLTAAVTGAALVVATLIAAVPAQAATTTPSDLYYPNDGCSSGAAPNFVFDDSAGNEITGDLYGDDGDQVTIHNQCTTATIYIYYGQSGTAPGSYVALAAGTQATYTLTNNVASVSAYSGNTGAPSQWASISVAAAPDIVTTGSAASTTLSSSSVSTAVSSTFIILNNGSDTLRVVNGTGTVTQGGILCRASGPCDISSGQTRTFTVDAQGTVSVGSATLTIGSGGGGDDDSGSSSTTSSSAPAPVVQQFGMPTTGTCDEAQPEGLNWSGVANGGWGVSWAQWMNNGNGGAVCTRTLVYSTTQSKWVVN